MDETKVIKAEILPEFSKDRFIRASWIKLAEEDAPIEVFNENFGSVSECEHQVLVDIVSVDVTYQASVGYDREEPYIAYEDYWEDEPYITTESYYDSNTKSTKTRQVTKYKQVKKQRQVTKYKTVTDWSPLSGNHSASSVAIVENISGQTLDQDLFDKSFRYMDKDSTVPLCGEAAEGLEVSDAAHDSTITTHSIHIANSVKNSLPGDHYRDLDWKISEITYSSTALYKTFEYEASICYDGKTYVKHAFPFGLLDVSGDKIKNPISLDAVTSKMRNEMNRQNTECKNAIEKNVSKATKDISLLTIGLLAMSIFVSLLIRSTILVVLMFAVAIAAFVFNTVKVKSEMKAETERANDEISTRTEKVNSEIANYSEIYKRKQREALNNKLKSLGYEPVKDAES